MRAWLRSFRRPLAMLRRHAPAVAIGVLSVGAFSVCKLWMVHVFGSTIDQLNGPEATPGDPRYGILTGAALAQLTLARTHDCSIAKVLAHRPHQR